MSASLPVPQAPGDFVTLLKSLGPKLTKTFDGDQVIAYGHARLFSIETVPVNDLAGLSRCLVNLSTKPLRCVIRGEFIGDEAAQQIAPPEHPGHYPRLGALFAEIPHHWWCADIDGFEPILYDPVTDPALAAQEAVDTIFPAEFHSAGYHWQLSSSAGRTPGKLKVHLWWWLAKPFTGPQLEAWVRSIPGRADIDIVTLRRVQVHYTANPIFLNGAVDPMAGVRHGLREGTPVALEISQDILDHAEQRSTHQGATDDEAAHIDPTQKPGIIGAFCKAYPISRVIHEVLPECFVYAGGSDRRVTWLGGNGAAEGCFVTGDDWYLGNTHNTSPNEDRLTNAWDVVRLYKFGHLDADFSADDAALAGIGDMPSQRAMIAWAEGLPDLKAPSDTTLHAALDEIAKLPAADVLERWLDLAQGLSQSDTAELLAAVASKTKRKVMPLKIELKARQQADAKTAHEALQAKKCGKRQMLRFAPENMTATAEKLDELLVESASPGRYILHGGRLGHVVLHELPYAHLIDAEDAAPPQNALIVPLDEPSLLAKVEAVAVFTVEREGLTEAISVPTRILQILLSRMGENHPRPVPVVTGLLSHPIVLTNGEILAKPGLHAKAGLFLADAAGVPGCRPYSPPEAVDALERLRHGSFLEGFEFDGSLADRDAAIAMLMTGVERRILDTAPGFAVIAAQQSSGKTTLVRRVHLILTGTDLPVFSMPTSEEEVQKLVLSAYQHSPAVFCIDNIGDGKTFRSEALAPLVTSASKKCRLLGSNTEVEILTNVLLCITGNNVKLGADEVSRYLTCRLAPSSINPQFRSFKNPDVVAHGRRIREDVLRDVVGIVAGFLAAKASTAATTRFPRWDVLVRQPLLWAGGSDVALGFAQNDANAEHLSARAAVFTALYAKFGSEAFTAAQVAEICGSRGSFGFPSVACADDLTNEATIADLLRSGFDMTAIRDMTSSRGVCHQLKRWEHQQSGITTPGGCAVTVKLRSRLLHGISQYRFAVV